MCLVVLSGSCGHSAMSRKEGSCPAQVVDGGGESAVVKESRGIIIK